MKSKVQLALDYMAKNPKASPCAAAKAVNLSPSVLYRAISRRSTAKCPMCGHAVAPPK